ncbi:hypothetical protein B2G47_19645 [Leptospira interrogans serovar Canicola]|nr:hypothetical protein B2G47_19645 [Leptospira interrogans serovar Canicola]
MICSSSYINLQTNISFVVVPTFKESICKVQLSAFFKIMSSLRQTHVDLLFVCKIVFLLMFIKLSTVNLYYQPISTKSIKVVEKFHSSD